MDPVRLLHSALRIPHSNGNMGRALKIVRGAFHVRQRAGFGRLHLGFLAPDGRPRICGRMKQEKKTNFLNIEPWPFK